MKIIKNSEELAKLLDTDKDLHLEDDPDPDHDPDHEDIRIEFQMSRNEVRDVYCRDLFLMNDDERFDFNGRNFNGRDFTGGNFNGGDFTGRDFDGWDFNGRNFNGRDFTGWDFNGGNFNGKKVSYYAFFNCLGSIVCDSIKARREKHAEPVSLEGKIEIRKRE